MRLSRLSSHYLALLIAFGALGSCGRDDVTAPEETSGSAALSAAAAGTSWSAVHDDPSLRPPPGRRGRAQSRDATILASTLYPTRAGFNAANPGLPLENFNDSNVGSGDVDSCSGPFNSSTNNACFSAGAILPGISLRAIGNDEMAVLGENFFGTTSDVVGPNFFIDDMEITFADEPCAVGLDLVSTSLGDGTVDMSVFDGNGNLLGVFTRTSSLAGTFFGISSDDGISRIVFDASGVAGELVDNVAFGCGLPTGPGTCQGEFTSPGVERISFSGVTTFIGTDHEDVIGGTNGIDIVLGKGEEDLICGWGARDNLDGGGGDDEIYGGNQDDFLFGKQGADFLDGEGGSDRLDGGHTPVPSSSPDTHPDTCVNAGRGDRLYLCEIVIGDQRSSALFKDHVIGLLPEGVTLFGVRPVAFRYVEPYGDPSVPQVGFIAEEVAEVYPEAIIYQDDRIWGIAYPELNAMLVEEAGKRATDAIHDGAARLLEAAF